MSDLVSCSHLQKWFEKSSERVDVLRGIDFSLRAGESVAIVGQSGTGKSTLLQILGGLMKPSQGSVLLKNQNIFDLSDEVRSHLRNKEIGFVFQFHHLLPDFTALENVCMPMWIRKDFGPHVDTHAKNLLESVGLGQRMNHRPSELSGGEQQRVSIARALVCNPSLVLADEPTGNLDLVTARKVSEVFFHMVKAKKCGLIIATHSLELAKMTDRVFNIADGKMDVA